MQPPKDQPPLNPRPPGNRSAGSDLNRIRDVRTVLQQTSDIFGGDPLSEPGNETPAGSRSTRPSQSTPGNRESGKDRLPGFSQARLKAAAAQPEKKSIDRRIWIFGLPALALMLITAGLLGNGVLLSDGMSAGQKQLVHVADSLLSAGDYENSFTRFMAVLKDQPYNTYVKERLAQIARLRSAEKSLASNPEEQFNRLSTQGDSLFNLYNAIREGEPALARQINWAAREAYVRALVYRPENEEIRTRIALLARGDSLLAGRTGDPDLTGLAETERVKTRKQQLALYQQSIEEGDALLARGEYLEAQIRFKEALLYQRDDTYAAGRLEMVESLLKQVTQKERYAAYLQRGDQLIEHKLYEQARSAYREALSIMPGDSTAWSRLAAVDREEQEERRKQNQDQERRRTYEKMIADGEALVASKKYEAALNLYLSAQKTYPTDAALEERIQRVSDLFDETNRINADGVYTFLTPEEQPTLIGSTRELYGKVRYPASAVAHRIEGRVSVEFIVDENGVVQNPRIIKGLSRDCDREVLRVIRSAQFVPAQVNGKKVKALQILPFKFVITEAAK